MKTITVKDAVEWVIRNRKGKAFLDYDSDKIAYTIEKAIKSGVFAYSLDSNGEFNGICCGDKVNFMTVIIHDILVTEKGIVKTFMKQFLNKFGNNTKIIGKAHGRDRIFSDPVKLYNKL